MKRIAIFATLCVLSCSALVLILYAFKENPYKEKNGFLRKENKNDAKLEESIDLKYTSYYFAGTTSDHLYLGNYQATGRILTVDYSLDSLSRSSLIFDNPGKFAWAKSRLSIDSPFIYLKDGMSPAVFRGSIYDLKMNQIFERLPYFSAGWNISNSSMVVRSIMSKEKRNILIKVTLDTSQIITNTTALTKQIDGIFCTEGSLSFDRENSSLTYTYYHRNEFIKMDTNLNILLRGHTIDTNKIAKISIANIESKNSSIFSAPPKYVNLLTSSAANKLYVMSALPADNDEINKFKKSSVIDVYSLVNGEYLKTIHIPFYEGKELGDFKVIGDKLYAIHDHFLCSYKIE